jgi:hypothetical protein
LQQVSEGGLQLTLTLEARFNSLTDWVTEVVTSAAEALIPKLQVTERLKPWWTPKLTGLRRLLNWALRQYKLNLTTVYRSAVRVARNEYFHEIRCLKLQHWEVFLSNAEGRDLFTALKFSKGCKIGKIPIIRFDEGGVVKSTASFAEKCDVFLTTLFPSGPLPSGQSTYTDFPTSPPSRLTPGPAPTSAPQSPTRSGSKVTEVSPGLWP